MDIGVSIPAPDPPLLRNLGLLNCCCSPVSLHINGFPLYALKLPNAWKKNSKDFPCNSRQLPKVLQAPCSAALLKGATKTQGPTRTARRWISEAKHGGVYIGHLIEANALRGQSERGGQGVHRADGANGRTWVEKTRTWRFGGLRRTGGRADWAVEAGRGTNGWLSGRTDGWTGWLQAKEARMGGLGS